MDRVIKRYKEFFVSRVIPVLILLVMTGNADALDSNQVSSKGLQWGIETSVFDGLITGGVWNVRAKMILQDKHNILFGMGTSSLAYLYGNRSARLGYQYSCQRKGKKMRWVWAYESGYAWRKHVSPSNLLNQNTEPVLTDVVNKTIQTAQYAGFGATVRVFKVIDVYGCLLVGFEYSLEEVKYSAESIETDKDTLTWFEPGLNIGISYTFNGKN